MLARVESVKPIVEERVQVEDLHKRFGELEVLKGVSLSAREGEVISLIGASGSGKSTLLRCINLLETPTRGRIVVDGEEIGLKVDRKGRTVPTDPRQVERIRTRLGMVFQSFNLWAHRTVLENVIEMPVHVLRESRAEAIARAEQLLERVGLADKRNVYPAFLSGGQQQRVALARSLVKRPKLLLLDEPMSALDKKIRQKTQLELVNIIEKVDVTCVMVTHDQEEAMTMASRLAVMSEGKIVQIGAPGEVYEFPNSRFSAEFIGSTNLFEGRVVEDEPDHIFVESDDLEARMYVSHGVTGPLGMPVGISVRPERVHVSREKPGSKHNWARGVVTDIAYMGSYSLYHVRLPSGKTVVSNLSSSHLMSDNAPAWNDDVFVSWSPASGVVLTQ